MPPFIWKWLILVAVRIVTITACTFAFVSSVVQLSHSVHAINARDDPTTSITPPSSDNKTTTIIQAPVNKLYTGSDVPNSATGPVFAVLYYVFLLATLLVILISELPLSRFLHQALKIQEILIHLIPQLCHKWGNTAVMGLLMVGLGCCINSRPVEKLEKAGGWLLFAAGFLNFMTGLVFYKHNIKHLRSIDLRKAAAAAAAGSHAGSKVTAVVRKYGWTRNLDEATVEFERNFRRGRSASANSTTGALPRPVTSPKKKKKDSHADKVARFSSYVLKVKRRKGQHDTDDTSRSNKEVGPVARERKTSTTPIYDLYTAEHGVQHHSAQHDPETSHFRIVNPFDATANGQQSMRRRRSSASTVTRASRAEEMTQVFPMTPSPAERSPGLVAAWREAAQEARRQARLANLHARRSLQLLKTSKRSAEAPSSPSSPIDRRGRGVTVEYRKCDTVKEQTETAQAKKPEGIHSSRRDSAAVAWQLLDKAATRNAGRARLGTEANKARTRRLSNAASMHRRNSSSQVNTVHDDGASFQLIDVKSTRNSGAKNRPPPYVFV